MTSRERLLTAFRGGIPDKVPVGPRLDSKWLENAGETLARRIIRTTDIVFYVDLSPDYVHFFGEEARRRCAIRTENEVRIEEIETPKGKLTRRIRIEKDMMDWAEKPFFEGPEDVEKALSIPFEPIRLDASEYEAWDERIGEEGIVLAHIPDALCCPGLGFTPDQFLIHTCATHTDLILQLLEKVSANILHTAGAVLDLGIRWIMISGPELASQTIMGPQWFPRLVTPFDTPLAGLIRERGGVTWCHCHGKIRAVHKDLAATGIHVLTPCEKPPQGDITLRELKESIGKRVCLAGNLDDLGLLASGNLKLVEQQSRECLDAAMEGGGFVLGGTEGCVFSKETAESYLFMCEVRDRYGVYV